MKKIVYKFLFTILLIFIYTNAIFADGELSCNKSIEMTEEHMSTPTHITATMPVCGTTHLSGFASVNVGPGVGVPEGGKQDFSDLDWVEQIGDFYDWYLVNSEDNKGTIPVYMPLCSDPASKIQGSMLCTFTRRKASKREETGYYEDYIDYECVQNLLDDQPIFVKPDSDQKIMDINPETDKDVLIQNPNVTKLKIAGLEEAEKLCTKQKWVFTGYNYYCEDDDYVISSDTTGIPLDAQNYLAYKWCENPGKWDYTVELDKGTDGINLKTAKMECEKENSVSKCFCKPATIKYSYLCPVYTCDKEEREVKLCTPTFKTPTGQTVYCVNPGQAFSATYSTTSSYMEDESFTVKDCESSYSTVDCGYANILIEGKYYDIEDKTIEFALRLWGVHTKQAGFDSVGVSSRTGDDCGNRTYFMKSEGYSGRIINPYVETYKEFAKEILNDIRYRDEIDPSKDYNLFAITCDAEKLGVACGSDNRYKQALALLANTVLGNSHMQEHLRIIFHDEIGESVDTAELITTEDGKQYIQVVYDELEEITRSSKVKINCNKLDQMVRDRQITQSQREQIEPFCSSEAYIVDGDGKRLTEFGGGTPAYCLKNYCRVLVEKFAICDLDEDIKTPVKIKVKYEKSQSSKSIKKYISCSNPTNNQILFGFDDDLLDETIGGTHQLGDPERETFEETFEIRDFKCEGKCEDYGIRRDPDKEDNTCDDDLKYNGVFGKTIKDPSLKCILNMGSPAYKNAYNYSEEFSVGNKFCRIYCSDEIKYNVADKIRETSGRKFYYDIERSVRKDKDIRYIFSNIIEEKRTCVSEIYYHNLFPESVDWAKTYSLGKNIYGRSDGITKTEIEGINNWESLFSLLVKKAKAEGGRTENLNKVLYDLYNCNLYTDEEIKDAGIVKPKAYKAANIKETIMKRFSGDDNNNYGIGVGTGCEFNPETNKNNCITMNNINYDFGAPPGGKSASMKSTITMNNTIDDFVYCSGESCFAYDEDHKDEEYNYPTSKTSSKTTLDVKTVLGESISAKVFTKDEVDIPTNDYVMFEVKADINFYNNSRYEVKPDGKVIIAGSERGKNYLKLETFTYPVDRYAYNSPVCSDRSFLSNDHYKRCNISQIYDRVETFFRKPEGDQFVTEVGKTKTFNCYVDVEMPSTECDPSKQLCRIGTTYRNVDIANIFPSSKDGYTTKTNSNWGTTNGRQATFNIQKSANEINVDEEYLQYSITLSPNQIRNIKSRNAKESGNYINEEVYGCQIVGDVYQNCISPFVEDLRKNKEYGTIDQKHNGK